jgi:hypothetical protein
VVNIDVVIKEKIKVKQERVVKIRIKKPGKVKNNIINLHYK